MLKVLFTELNITKKLTMLGSSDKEVQDWMQAIEAGINQCVPIVFGVFAENIF